MRKNLLFVLGLVVTMTAFSQVPTETIWSKSFTPITVNLKMPQNQVMAVDASGAAIVTGTMMQSFTFAGKTIEALTSNANYIAKYSGTGEELWAVVVEGGNINAITTDPEGNIYIAGTFKEIISLGSISGNAIEKEGSEDNDNAFLAKYNTNGTALKAEAIIPQPATDNFLENPSIEITQLIFINNKIYAAIQSTGADATIGSINIKGGYYMENELFMNLFSRTAHVISLSNDLIAEKLIANIGISENGLDRKSDVTDPKFTINNNTLYIGAEGSGSIKVTTSSDSKEIIYSPTVEDLVSYGFIIAGIDLNNETITAKNYEITYSGFRSSPLSVSGMTTNNNSIIIVGIYESEKNPFNPDQAKTGVMDMTIASLNSDLNVNWSITSGYNEGTGAFTDSENFNSMTVFGNELDIMATIKNYRKNASNIDEEYISKTYTMTVNMTNGTATTPTVSDATTTINTGIAGNGTNLLSASAIPSESKMTFTMAGNMPDAIGEIGNSTSTITVLNTIVTDAIQLSETADVTITNLSGVVVKATKAIDQINVSNLPSGSYFVTINGITTKVQKI